MCVFIFTYGVVMIANNQVLKNISSLIILCSHLIVSSCYGYEIEKINSIFELASHLTPQTLLITDLDHTLMEPLTYEGSEPWFQHMIHLGTPHEKTVAIDFYCKIQSNIQMRAVESALPVEWQKWKQLADVATIGLTSRAYCLASITHEQLSLIGVGFPNTWLIDDEMPGIAYDGILFASGRNKGEVVDKFLQTHPQFQSWKIVFIDDSYHHLEFVGSTIETKYPHAPKPILLHYSTSRERFEKARFVPALEESKRTKHCCHNH